MRFPATHAPARRRRALLAAVLLAAFGAGAQAQSAGFPNKPVKIIVPSSPGGLMDTSARLVGAKLSAYWNVPVVVENKPGAGMAIGTQMAAKAPADGYTLLLAHEGAVVINPVIVADTPYSVKDFVPLAQVWDTSLMLVVNKDVPASNFAELSAYVKKNPGKLNYPVADMIGELMSDMVKHAAGWEYTTITYKGNADRLRSLMAGETQMTLASTGDAVQAVESGRAKAIGLSSKTRSPRLPNVPTLHEAGLKDFNLMTWGGLFAPAGTPPAILAKLSADARRALAEPDVVEKIEAGGSEVGRVTAEQFAARIQADVVRWRQLAERRGMKTYDR